MSTPHIQTLIQKIQTNDPIQQDNALTELQAFRAPEAVPFMLPMLMEQDDSLRAQAARTLGRVAAVGDVNVGIQLMTLLHDQGFLVRSEAAESLGLLQFTSAPEALKQVMISDPHWLVRVSAIEALDAFKDRGLLSDFQALLANEDEEYIVQRYAAEALSGIAMPQDLPIIERDIAALADIPEISVVLLTTAYRLGAPGSFAKIGQLLDLLTMEDDIPFIFNNIDTLTVGSPPPLAQADIPSLFSPLDSLVQRIPDMIWKVDALKQRLRRVQAGDSISPDESRCC